MSIFKYSAAELYSWLTSRDDITVLDVRNKVDFARFQVESPYPFNMVNVSYFDFMEIEDECVAKVPRHRPVRVVCAKEGSAKFVAEILEKHGFDDIGYLEGGIKSWGNLLVPKLLNPGGDYSLYQFIRPGKASCSYGLLYDGRMMLFDPSRNVEFYKGFGRRQGARLIRTFETHLQADYIAGSRLLAADTGAEMLANEGDFKGANFVYTKLADNQTFGFNGSGPEVRVMFTPGHTPGSTSYLIDDRYLISGDTVFISSIGRPDLGGQVASWSDLLFATLKKVAQLDPATLVLPGHYVSWTEANDRLEFVATLKETIDRNKEIYAIDNPKDFLVFIKNNMRKQPDEYAMIRKVNANLEQVDDDKAEELDLGKNECAASAYAAQQQQQQQAEA
jgi:glyoxylase-like metal-dependent hydrolase (beta-lactamase superfamily II)/rhodanese-related sulfurtransferase